MKTLRITARPASGFRRAGIHHPPIPIDHPAERFTAGQLEALKAEPELLIEEIHGEGAVGTKDADGAAPAADAMGASGEQSESRSARRPSEPSSTATGSRKGK